MLEYLLLTAGGAGNMLITQGKVGADEALHHTIHIQVKYMYSYWGWELIEIQTYAYPCNKYYLKRCRIMGVD